jgi:hypothetical protein
METWSIESKAWLNPAPDTLETAIIHTLAYADVFDYPLTVAEVHRYLVGMPASLDTVQNLLNDKSTDMHLSYRRGYYTLPEREFTIETRRRRAEVAAQMWPLAVRYGLDIARLPFVRMVAVTGSLTVDNVDTGDDIDYLVITEPDRLWLCRAVIIQFVVKAAEQRGHTLCPNYFLTEQALVLPQQNLFTAHEIAQMVPIAGLDIYNRLRQLNDWVFKFLPNARGQPRRVHIGESPRRTASLLAEAILRTPAAALLENWEMNRKIRKLSQQAQSNQQREITFCAEWCKGHFESHGKFIMEAFSTRLGAIEAKGVPNGT